MTFPPSYTGARTIVAFVLSKLLALFVAVSLGARCCPQGGSEHAEDLAVRHGR